MFEIESAYLDVNAIEEGRWVPLGADFPGVEVFARGLSSAGAKAFDMKLRREAKSKDRLSNGLLTEDAHNRIFKEVLVEKCVTDWRGFSSGGKPLPFAKETLLGFLTEPRARAIGKAIVNAITVLEQTTKASEAEVVGNLPAS